MHDVKNVRSPVFGEDLSNPYSVNQRARIVCMNPVDHGVINSVKANGTAYQRIDRGMTGFGFRTHVCAKRTPSVETSTHPSVSTKQTMQILCGGTPTLPQLGHCTPGFMRRSCHDRRLLARCEPRRGVHYLETLPCLFPYDPPSERTSPLQ
jgi:hypothetical protein